MVELKNLKHIFEDIKDKKNYIENLLTNINSKINIIKNNYDKLLQDNNIDGLNIFDSLYFQQKIFDIQYNNHINLFTTIINNMYKKYYNLLKKLEINNNIDISNSLLKNYEVYKHLQDKNYSFENIVNINEDIFFYFDKMNININNNIDELQKYLNILSDGIKINTFCLNKKDTNDSYKKIVESLIEELNIYYEDDLNYFNILIDIITFLYNNIKNEIKRESNEGNDNNLLDIKKTILSLENNITLLNSNIEIKKEPQQNINTNKEDILISKEDDITNSNINDLKQLDNILEYNISKNNYCNIL